MEPKTLSATSIQKYEACPAGWRASYIDGARTQQGMPAAQGTAVHSVLDRGVNEYRNGADWSMKRFLAIWNEEFNRLGLPSKQYDEGKKMVETWVARNAGELTREQILSTELKETFLLFLGPKGTPEATVPVTYIFDRCDRIERGDGKFDIKVIDYKTVSAPISSDDLKRKVQARIYSLAARLKYPDADRIWVVFDLLRYEPVGRAFTKDEDIETWRYLQAMFRRLRADDGTFENLNPDCRYCVRKLACESLTKHAAAGGSLGITDPHVAAETRLRLDSARAALSVAVDELDEFLLGYMEREQVHEFDTEQTHVKATARRTRDVDTQVVVNIVGEELAAAYGKIGVTAVEQLLKDHRVTNDQKSALKASFTNKWGEPRIKVTPIQAIGDDA